MAIEWTKTNEEDRGFHESMKTSPFGRIDPYIEQYGDPTLTKVLDVHGLEVKFYFWELERKNDKSPYYAMVMQVEEEPFEDTHWIKESDPEEVMKEYLLGFSVPIFESELPKIEMGDIQFIHIPCGLFNWAEDRKHLFDNNWVVKEEYQKSKAVEENIPEVES